MFRCGGFSRGADGGHHRDSGACHDHGSPWQVAPRLVFGAEAAEIADQLSAKGWTLGWVAYQARDFDGWKVDAHKDGQHHHVLAEEIE
jgi:hypothetical protein